MGLEKNIGAFWEFSGNCCLSEIRKRYLIIGNFQKKSAADDRDFSEKKHLYPKKMGYRTKKFDYRELSEKGSSGI